ncbi:hypothetical protein BDD12DRAFT_894774 [Trichophaea hybrida]|nr:hypothetical protein BDD12DRAFT_894774 [Trichophaea hybrida]
MSRQLYYLVQWKHIKNPSWEPEENLHNYREVLDGFMATLGGRKVERGGEDRKTEGGK